LSGAVSWCGSIVLDSPAAPKAFLVRLLAAADHQRYLVSAWQLHSALNSPGSLLTTGPGSSLPYAALIGDSSEIHRPVTIP